jgi:hypothetical protein
MARLLLANTLRDVMRASVHRREIRELDAALRKCVVVEREVCLAAVCSDIE